MPQEFYVLKCFSCETFQVHIVKKAKKWECKMCGSKQSLKRNYGKGSSKDCRNQVMKLNELRLSKCNSLNQMENEIFNETWSENPFGPPTKEESKEHKPTTSKWAEYVEESLPDTESAPETDENTSNNILCRVDKKKKRMKKVFDGCYSKNKKICREDDESEMFSQDNKETAKFFSVTKNYKKVFNCIDKLEKTTDSQDFIQLKNESKPGKYKKYLDQEDFNDFTPEKINKTSNIFESDLSDLDDVLNF